VETARDQLADIEERLQPRLVRARALERLDALFTSGTVPDPSPDGFCAGRPLMVSASPFADAAGRRLGELHMPWLGKAFDRRSSRGVNVLTRRARLPMRILWPSYVPERELADRIEAFPFRTWVGPAEVDPGTDVLKIDYDLEPNPHFVRRVLDELVQIDDRLYLGKVLLRRQLAYRPLGFFALWAGPQAT